MKYKQIPIIILLLCLSIVLYLFIQDKSKITTKPELNTTIKKIDIPKIIIPKKSMDFSISKNKDKNISFRGTFSIPTTPKEIAKLLDNSILNYQIKIDNRREDVNETILFVKKILTKFTDSFTTWSIIYKDRKLLITGKTTSSQDKNNLERVINLSLLDIFTNIEIVKPRDKALDVISNLKLVVDEEESKEEDNLSEDDIEDILLNLKSLAVKEFRVEKKVIKNNRKKREIRRKKRKIIVKKRKIIVKKKKPVLIIKKKAIKIKEKKLAVKKVELKAKIVNRIKPSPTIDINSLPFVKSINIDEVKYMKTKKPLVKERTIYIKSDEYKKYKDIPWAKLHDINEKVNGIFIQEIVNKP